ncbi:MAG: ATP-binding protein [Anaerolineales bacterium]|nr:ATP-binding protein [Anaerolineales bacterium]
MDTRETVAPAAQPTPSPAASGHAGPPDVPAGLRLVERLLRLEIARLRAMGLPAGHDEYRGLYISDEEVDQLLGLGPRLQGTEAVESYAAALSRERAALARLTQDAGGPLGELIRLAGLNSFDVGCVLLGLALEADSRMERLFAYVQDDVTKRRPRVEIAIRLLAERAGHEAARQNFAADAPLRRLLLLNLYNEPGQPFTPLPAQTLGLHPRIAGFLLGLASLDEALRGFAVLHPGTAAPQPLPFNPRLVAQLDELAALPPTRLAPPVLAVQGRHAADFRHAALRLITGTGLQLLTVDLPGLSVGQGLETALTLAEREAALQPAALLLQDLHKLKPDEAAWLRARLQHSHLAPLTLLGAEGGFNWPGLTIQLPAPDFDARKALWGHRLGELAVGLPPEVIEGLAEKFSLSTAQIADAVAAARAAAMWRSPESPRVTADDLYAAARTQSTPILNSLARKIVPHYDWDDIVLPADTVQQLREIALHMEHRHLVFQTWGFARRLALGKGLMSLFAGASGTGKTMAADIIANALGLDLYKIDLSGVVSKYIGETEKNLDHIFAEAETANAILFFDEADALFGKRSEVKDAHDRYANIETAYLLQKMEEYSGAVILATNLKMNLDDAFVRRMQFVVDFPLPEEDDRRRIWRVSLPPELPLGPDVDLDYLAHRFKIAGGHIRNIVVASAFLAAADGRLVTMAHLLQATRREFQKIGRMVIAGDFEPQPANGRGSSA